MNKGSVLVVEKQAFTEVTGELGHQGCGIFLQGVEAEGFWVAGPRGRVYRDRKEP